MNFDEFILCAEILHNKHVIIKSEGKYMNREIEQVILAQGYRFCTVQPENVGVFYKYYQQGFHVVMMISLDDTKTLTIEQHQVMQERVMDLFYHPQGRLADFPEGYPVYHVELLTLLAGRNTDMMHQLCSVQKNVWGYETKQGRLIIYENQPGDFWGLKSALENCRVDSKVTRNINTGFEWKKLSYTTIAIAAINVIVYLILEILGDTQDPFYIASHGGMYPEFLQVNHQWWRIITAMFIHFGLPHLVNNMVIFCCVGSRLERAVGHLKMFVIYMLSGIGGGILSYFMMLYSGDYAVSAGASGAVFGMIGGLIWVVIRHRGRFEGLTVKGMMLMVALSLYYGFSTIGIDNWCHVGGILTGFLAAMILYHKKVENC
jgi:rhomboid protease GluP